MKVKYDFHIHTCLSPCADNDMTPSNIALMAKLAGLDIIAITDHNSSLNAQAVKKASEREDGPLVLAGMELETQEGIHIILLFADCETAKMAAKEVKDGLPDINNNQSYYGDQLVLNEDDVFIHFEERLLVMPSSIPLYGVKAFADKYGAACYPAHIDREGNGILSVMGEIDDDMGFAAIGITPQTPDALIQKYAGRGYKVLRDSDSHELGTIGLSGSFIHLNEISVTAALDYLKTKNKL